jgi:WD40 repeat protein
VGGIADVHFTNRDRLLAAIHGTGLVSFDLKSGASRVVVAQPIGQFVATRDGRFAVGTAAGRTDGEGSPVFRFGLEDGSAQALPAHGTDVTAIALDASRSFIATGSSDGTIRVGPISGEEPHLLLGQQGSVHSIAFSRDGRWLATGGEAFAVHVWPMPDLSKPPLHRRSRADLLNVLRSHTNLQAIPDAASATGYKLIPGPFPGWAKVPEW